MSRLCLAHTFPYSSPYPNPTRNPTPTPTPTQVDLLHDSGPLDSDGLVLPAPVRWATRGGVNAGGQRTYDVATEPLIQVGARQVSLTPILNANPDPDPDSDPKP